MSSLTSIRRARAGPAPAAILAAAALMLAACSPIDEVEFQPAFKRQFSTRKQPAEVTTVSEEELRKQGYVRIGRVIIRHLQDKSYATDSATACRKQAVAEGGRSGAHAPCHLQHYRNPVRQTLHRLLEHGHPAVLLPPDGRGELLLPLGAA